MAYLWYLAVMLVNHLVAALLTLVFLCVPSTGCQTSTPTTRREPAIKPTLAAAAMRNSNGTPQTFPPPPADILGKMQVFAYADFGPQVAADKLLGADCYGDCCCGQPTDRFDVRVVVFAGVDRTQVAARFVSSATLGEYRLIELPAALRYLETTLAELQQGADQDRIPALERVLQATLSKLRRDFASSDATPAP